MVTLTFASWNQIAHWLKQLEELKRAASPVFPHHGALDVSASN